MSRIAPEGRLTRAERLATVVAVIGAVLIHVVALFGWGRISRWAQEERKKERLMVIRRVREVMPQREAVPEPPGRRQAPGGTDRVSGGDKAAPPPPPEPKVREKGPEPPKPSELSPAMEQELLEKKPDQARLPEPGNTAVSVVTDLPTASFIVNGPSEFRGSGTFWIRKGAPPGTYTVTFNPVAGFSTPPVQSKDLAAQGQIVFVGKYRRSIEVIVDSNEANAQVTIYRPDGGAIDLSRPGRALLDDLPPGTYTAVFKEIPGHVTPSPLTRTLGTDGKLSFFGNYADAGAGSGGAGTGGGGAGAGRGPGTSGGRGAGGGTGTGSGSGSGRGGSSSARKGPGSAEAELDRRVQVVVKSYPPTAIEEGHEPISYPEVIIRKSRFQQGWCQVYLILQINGSGEVGEIFVERPRPEERSQYEPLIRAVEKSVAAWDYDRVKAEVHVDVRFYVE
jgi:hypothetical protein